MDRNFQPSITGFDFQPTHRQLPTTPMATKTKFLILNPSPTNLDKVLEKSNLQNEKNGPFEATLLLGDVLPESVKQLPQTELTGRTYFSRGQLGISSVVQNLSEAENLSEAANEIIPEGVTEALSLSVDVKTNLTYLKNLVTTIKLGSFTFMYVVGETKTYQDEIIRLVKENTAEIDILVTYDWPYAIAKQQQLSLVGDKLIDDVVKEIKPRYHFCVGHEYGKFYESLPFKWSGLDKTTRFVSLGQEGSGEKWFYAFGMSKFDTEVPKVTENPFTQLKRQLESSPNDGEVSTTSLLDEPMPKRPKISPKQCFFCLSNPKVETHMIISIGTHSYLTVAKGPLTRANKNLNFSGHAIIIPIEHVPTLRHEGTNITDSPVFKEIDQYQKTLVRTFQTNKPFYRLVFFEINCSTNIHHHIQFLPIPQDAIEAFIAAVHDKATQNNERFERNQKLEFKLYSPQDLEFIRITNNLDYILFTLFRSESETTILVCELTEHSKSVDLQFPRRVLAQTLGLQKRVRWDKCIQPRPKEAEECEEFKKFYHDFDFTV